MSQWRELYEYVVEKLEAVRNVVDVDEKERTDEFAVDVQRNLEQSRAEQILQKMTGAIDAVLREEIIRSPSGKAFAPEKFIIFLNSDDDRDWQGRKREFVRQELEQIVLREARRRAGQSELVIDKIAVEFRVDGTLDRSLMRVQAVLENERELTVFADNEKTFVAGAEHAARRFESEDKQTTFAEPLYTLEIEQDGQSAATIPIYKREIVIGRGATTLPVDVPLPAAAVSRRHAVLEFTDENQFFLTHTGANPTAVDGAELSPNEKTPFQTMQKIEIGGFTIQIKPNF